jgi:apolipoprotein N-acyltransferase
VTPSGKISLLDFVKSAIFFGASLAWVAVALRFVTDTQAGVVALAVPFFLILGASVYFFARGLRRLLRVGD